MRHGPIAALTIAILFLLAAPAAAQSGRIRGKVTDEQGQPVPGATVEVASVSGRAARWLAKTNDSGEYIIITLPSGRYLVTVSKEGVGTAQTSAEIVSGGLTAADVTLTKSTFAVEGPCADRTALPPFDERVAAAFADEPSLARFLRWLEAVHRHTPGCTDASAVHMTSWSRQDLETLLRDVGRISAALDRFRQLKERNPVVWQEKRVAAAAGKDDPAVAIRLHDRVLTLDQIEAVFHGNETLRRGAVLHADIAAFLRDDLGPRPVIVEDGRKKGNVRGTVHWDFGRRLLDAVTPSAADDAGAKLWYRAVSAYLFQSGRLDELLAHLHRAREVFAGQPVFLIDSAYLHEKFASPAIQTAVQELRAGGAEVPVDSRAAELERAERFLRQALALTPDDAEARLRLGRVLGELRRHDEAASELRKAIGASPDTRRMYLAELFLGREEQALGMYVEARRHFENAAALYPTAQSPWLALSQLARHAGDRAAALSALRRVTARPASIVVDDPWWFYHDPHLQDADVLMAQMRKMGSAAAR